MKCPATPADVELSFYTPRSVWQRSIGKTKDGKPKRFYFGSDLADAKVQAWELWRRWEQRPEGVESWEALYMYRMETMLIKDGVLHSDGTQNTAYGKTPSETHQAPTGITLADAKALYLAQLKKRVGLVGSLGVLPAYHAITEQQLKRVWGFIPAEITHLNQLDYSTLEALVYKLASRPNKWPNPLASPEVQKAQASQRISQRTSLDLIEKLSGFLHWCEEEELGYILPRKTRRLWAIKPEADEQQIRTLSVDEVATLWAGAVNPHAHGKDKGEQRRLFIALGLNCGFYSVDISTLTADHIVDGEFIWKLRRKTRKTNTKSARTKWKLWDETKELLTRYMPLDVTPNSIRSAWNRLCEATGIKCGHSNLRDTGAVWMEKIGSRELADVYLSHARGGVIDSYSHPDWDKLSAALQRFREEFFSPALAKAKKLEEASSESSPPKGVPPSPTSNSKRARPRR